MADEHAAMLRDLADEQLAMMRAVLRGDPDALLDSIRDGATLSFVYPVTGWTALLLAVEHEWPTLVAVLLAAGADPNQPTRNGWTALHQAVDIACDGASKQGYEQPEEATIKLLLAAGADPGIPNASGETPLDFARDYNWAAGLNLLARPRRTEPRKAPDRLS